MPKCSTMPARIFHIAERDAWVQSLTLGHYIAPSLASEGFIHCSTREQVLATANRYYRGQSGLVLFCIDAAPLSSQLKYDAPAPLVATHASVALEGLFPHVYGPIDVHAIARVVEFEPNANGEFGWPADADVDFKRDSRASSSPDRPRSPAENLVEKDARIQRFWVEFCQQAGVPIATHYQAWYFGDGAELAHELVDLVVHGPKRGTASLLWSVQRHPELAPIPNAYSVVTEFDATPRAVIRTTRVEVRAFDAVDAQFAWDEGEDDRSLEAWRVAHVAYFSRECALLGRQPSADMPVVLERFEFLYSAGGELNDRSEG